DNGDLTNRVFQLKQSLPALPGESCFGAQFWSLLLICTVVCLGQELFSCCQPSPEMTAPQPMQRLDQNSRHPFGTGPGNQPLAGDLRSERQFEPKLNPRRMLQGFTHADRHSTFA